MEILKFPKLTASEIECRVGIINEKGCSLLLYKDARCDIRILDDTVGALNWKREHFEAFNYLFCRVSIYDPEKQQWTWKEDTGTPSRTEAEKGHASDSFKRACFNWGIGIELYTAPFIWINLAETELFKNDKGKPQLSSRVRFSVKEIQYVNNKISKLIIVDQTGKQRYSFDDAKPAKKADVPANTLAEKTSEPKVTEKHKQQWIETAEGDLDLIKRVLNDSKYKSSNDVPIEEFETINDLIQLEVTGLKSMAQ